MLSLPNGFADATDPSAWISADCTLACLGQTSGGVNELLFHGPQPQAGNTFLLRGEGALTWGIDVRSGDGRRHVPHRFANVALHPFACETRFVDGGLAVSTWTGLIDNALLVVTRLRNEGPGPLRVRLRARLDASALATQVHGHRQWHGPAYVAGEGQIRVTAHDQLHTLDWINVPGFADASLDTRVHGWLLPAGPAGYEPAGQSHTLVMPDAPLAPGAETAPQVFMWVCGGDEDEMRERAGRLVRGWPGLVEIQQARYARVAEQSPRLHMPGHAGLEAAFRLAPGYVEGAKVNGTGSIRASAGGDYFVWGWDALISAHEFYRWGDAASMAAMVRFFETHRAGDGSIPHRYDNQLGVLQATGYDFNTQIFISLVYHTYLQARDRSWLAERYPLIRELFLKMADQTDERGLFACLGMYPDAPEKLGRTPAHYIAEEQGFWYSVCRMMERIARQLGDMNLAARAADIGRRVRHHFLPLFFDPQAGAITDSVAPDGSRNGTYPLWALMVAHTPDGIELLQPHWQALADDIESRLMTERGINMVPDDDPHYGTETVTSSCWFMHFDVYALRLLRRAGRTAAILRWLDMAGRLFEEYLCVPELVRTSPEWVRAGRHLQAGQRWQMFATMGWYRALVEAVAGVEHDMGGLTLIPADLTLDLSLAGHHFGAGTWDVSVTGRGAWWGDMSVDGQPVSGTYKLPVDCATVGHHRLLLARSTAPPSQPILMAAPGAAVLSSGYRGDVLQIRLSGDGPASVRVWSPRPAMLRWNGAVICTGACDHASMELDLRGDGLLEAQQER